MSEPTVFVTIRAEVADPTRAVVATANRVHQALTESQQAGDVRRVHSIVTSVDPPKEAPRRRRRWNNTLADEE